MRQNHDAVKSIEGENDFSGKRYVWLKDPQEAFVKGWVIGELEDNKILVQTDNGAVSYVFGMNVYRSMLTGVNSNEKLMPRVLIK